MSFALDCGSNPEVVIAPVKLAVPVVFNVILSTLFFSILKATGSLVEDGMSMTPESLSNQDVMSVESGKDKDQTSESPASPQSPRTPRGGALKQFATA